MLYIFDSLCLNRDAGGVLQFTASLISGFDQLGVGTRKSLDYSPATKRFGRFFHEIAVASMLKDASAQCIFPNYFLPPLLNRRIASKSIVVIHDFQYKYLPEFFSKKKRVWLDLSLRRAHENAGAIVCISEATRNDYVKFLGNRDNLFVVNNPVSVGDVENSDLPSLSFERYLIANCHFYPHKNFEGVIDLYLKMKVAGYRGKLVLTGGGRDKYIDFISTKFSEVTDEIIHLGYLPQRQLRALQANADALLSLSRFEGFNLPAAECAVLGVPLILSDIPVHRELFPDSMFVSEYLQDVNALIRKIDSFDISAVRTSVLRQRWDPKEIALAYQEILNKLRFN